jgi:hypothetical protein
LFKRGHAVNRSYSCEPRHRYTDGRVSVAAGTCLGACEISASFGKGGIGAAFRMRDISQQVHPIRPVSGPLWTDRRATRERC